MVVGPETVILPDVGDGTYRIPVPPDTGFDTLQL
jgi:hypothetical protein